MFQAKIQENFILELPKGRRENLSFVDMNHLLLYINYSLMLVLNAPLLKISLMSSEKFLVNVHINIKIKLYHICISDYTTANLTSHVIR